MGISLVNVVKGEGTGMAASKLLIKTENISKVYRTKTVETTAVHQVSVEVFSSDKLAIVGPSGSGKSSLLGLLGLMEKPTSGNIEFFGAPSPEFHSNGAAGVRRKFGFVFQNFGLIDRFSLLENVALAIPVEAEKSDVKRSRALEALDRVGLKHRAGHYPEEVSGGQQQRAAVARAIVSNPKIIFADEPTGNLDSASGADVMDALDEARDHESALIIVTHDQEIASRATRRFQMMDGTFLPA